MLVSALILWALAAILAAWWLWSQQPEPAPAPPATDPYADAVAEFRRQLHDWDRNG